MNPFQFTHCSSSSSSSSSIAMQEHPGKSLPAPSPSTLNMLVPSSPKTSTRINSINIETLRPDTFTHPALLPSMVEMLNTSADQSKPRFTLRSVLAQTVDCIRQHSLLKNGQQVRDEQLEQALYPQLPTVLIGMIKSYSPEPSLLPLQIDHYGYAVTNANNQPIFEQIQQLILSNEPEKQRFQMEVIKHHGSALDVRFAPDIGRGELRELLNQAGLNQQEAVSELQTEFEIMTNYLPYSDCQHLLENQSHVLKTCIAYGGDDEPITFIQIVHDLLADAMRKIRPESQIFHQAEALQTAKADRLMAQAKAELAKNSKVQACKFVLDALHIFCQLRERGRVGEILVQLIELNELSESEPSDSFPDLLTFFGFAKSLCLVYPSDFRLYADLLFAMVEVCEKRQDFSTARSLMQQADKDGMRLPVYYESRLVSLKIRIEHLAGQSAEVLLQQIKSALQLPKKFQDCSTDRATSSLKKPVDLNYIHLHLSRCYLYQLLGKLSAQQLDQFPAMNFQQQDDCVSQYVSEPFIKLEGRRLNTEASQRYDDSVFCTPAKWMVLVSAAHYAHAINDLIVTSFGKLDSTVIEKEALAIYDSLVALYVKTLAIDELDALLKKDDIYRFLRLPSFKARFATWRETLSAMKETVKKTKASETDS